MGRFAFFHSWRKMPSSDNGPAKNRSFLEAMREIHRGAGATEKGTSVKRIKEVLGALVFFLGMLGGAAAPAAEAPSVQVGRVYHIDGELLRHVPENNDWVAVTPDAPFGASDSFFSGSGGAAELILPDGSLARVGSRTQIRFIALTPELSEADVPLGTARFHNQSAGTRIKASSPFGYVLADPGTVFDIRVGETSVEVTALTGQVAFFQSGTHAKTIASPGAPAILADSTRVSLGVGTADPAWTDWNAGRDNYWASRSAVPPQSTAYLPPSLAYDAGVLDEYGAWDRFPYDGQECWFWRPTTVAATWSPFTVGSWTVWYGDETWIPREPFGYITHHYGNWVFTRGRWYWAPPVAHGYPHRPLLNVGYFWYPGRVSWIHRGEYLGWIPLAPSETYYSRHDWGGPHNRRMPGRSSVPVDVDQYAYSNHAIIVDQQHFHGGRDYDGVRLRDFNPEVIKAYRAAPVLDNTVIRNYATDPMRYRYTPQESMERPEGLIPRDIPRQDRNLASPDNRPQPDRFSSPNQDDSREIRSKPYVSPKSRDRFQKDPAQSMKQPGATNTQTRRNQDPPQVRESIPLNFQRPAPDSSRNVPSQPDRVQEPPSRNGRETRVAPSENQVPQGRGSAVPPDSRFIQKTPSPRVTESGDSPSRFQRPTPEGSKREGRPPQESMREKPTREAPASSSPPGQEERPQR